jgi:hypothetical protein
VGHNSGSAQFMPLSTINLGSNLPGNIPLTPCTIAWWDTLQAAANFPWDPQSPQVSFFGFLCRPAAGFQPHCCVFHPTGFAMAFSIGTSQNSTSDSISSGFGFSYGLASHHFLAGHYLFSACITIGFHPLFSHGFWSCSDGLHFHLNGFCFCVKLFLPGPHFSLLFFSVSVHLF